jgi:hypothetical protein
MGWTQLQYGWIKNTTENLKKKNIGSQPGEKPKDRWIDVLTRDARKLLGAEGWKNWH